ncbi:hypothetical protein J8273_2595 [Carpediemonas membranifera]|uniref:Uncharacterized protein n=1 Tax=Carpediemonas membranifera TaxID=201153 RepID=A0A8J6B5R7_9EUKA|nr:hypothetical protein J8273_2595 [Carpediemonas membranifera]|eukprot:KAG9396243.1 hypothetical protein J8273_2595 [Carpediemonas membranifera]
MSLEEPPELTALRRMLMNERKKSQDCSLALLHKEDKIKALERELNDAKATIHRLIDENKRLQIKAGMASAVTPSLPTPTSSKLGLAIRSALSLSDKAATAGQNLTPTRTSRSNSTSSAADSLMGRSFEDGLEDAIRPRTPRTSHPTTPERADRLLQTPPSAFSTSGPIELPSVDILKELIRSELVRNGLGTHAAMGSEDSAAQAALLSLADDGEDAEYASVAEGLERKIKAGAVHLTPKPEDWKYKSPVRRVKKAKKGPRQGAD